MRKHLTAPNHQEGLIFPMISSNTTASAQYPQAWKAYNAAQCAEKTTFMGLLGDLCASVPQPEYKRGRPRLPISDMLFSACFKVYSGFSARRFNCDVEDAHAKGFIDCHPSFISVNRYLADPALTPIIKGMVEASAAPLSAVESHIAVDASGFSTSRFDRWYSAKWGREKSHRRFMKAHIAVGVQSNIVTAIEVTPGKVSDSVMMPALLDTTAQRFNIPEVSADKGYTSEKNVRHITDHGADAFIPFRVNASGRGSALWQQLYAHFVLNQTAFMRRYHLRSNAETVFMMVKTKFGDAVRSKSETGQINEVLLKFLCHNLVVLVHAAHEMGIDISLESKVESDSKIIWLNQKS